MKPIGPAPGCSCGHRPPREPRPPHEPTGNFLMQRILACGKIHRRCQCYSLCLNDPPCHAHPPFTVVDISAGGPPSWQEIPCHERGVILLQLCLPLALRLRDECGCLFTAASVLEEEIRLRLSVPEGECWRGQFHVQAAVRPCGSACICQNGPFDARLEVCAEAYLLTACQMGSPKPPPCPPPRPWYPQPSFDPWQDR